MLFQPRTDVVDGPLAFRMRRTAAAQAGEHGLEVMTLPLLAARLAGGFRQPATVEQLQFAVRTALAAGGFQEIEAVRALPGTARAMLRTLSAAWRADVDLSEEASRHPRLADLALVQERIREVLPEAALIAPDLRDAALTNVDRAAGRLGPVVLQGMLDVDRVWRSLLVALAARTDLVWQAPPGRLDVGWFPGRVEAVASTAPTVRAEVCADPRAEVVEALRWARDLMSRGTAASDIGIAAPTPEAWDEHVLVLARDADLPVHFSHGLPALETSEGQACAALAEVLLSGLSQERVRRLLRRAPSAAPDLPEDWGDGLSRAAGLFTAQHWRRALVDARPKRRSGELAEAILIALVDRLSHGPTVAAQAGDSLLTGEAQRLWRTALGVAPAEALRLALQTLRVPDTQQAAAAVSWGPASHLAGAPRRHIRLLGLSSRGWPRGRREDPLLPGHILDPKRLESMSRSERDLDHFTVLTTAASDSVVLSRARRSAEGALLPPSRLWPQGAAELARTRIPAHAMSESDRLLARPPEAASQPHLASTRLCWMNWRSVERTAHDGLFAAEHPVLARTLSRPQSATSLRRLLRDPLGFVWRYVLGWRTEEVGGLQLTTDPRTFGELTHEILRQAVNSLEPDPGFAKASGGQIDAAVAAAADAVLNDWPLERVTPPPQLWRRTVEAAAKLAGQALRLDETLGGTRSWTEVVFGEIEPPDTASIPDECPWDPTQRVVFGGLAVRGRIDRLDLRAAGDAARVTDYKTGATPRQPDALVLDQGRELQRVLYAAAARQLLPDLRQSVSRLAYLRDGPRIAALSGDGLDAAFADAEGFVEIAVGLLKAGHAPAGPDALDTYNDLRLAMPAELDAYMRRKERAFGEVAAALSPLWSRR